MKTETPAFRAKADTMADTTASQYGLRARVEPDNRPLGQQSDRQRGMKAAFEVLKRTLSQKAWWA